MGKGAVSKAAVGHGELPLSHKDEDGFCACRRRMQDHAARLLSELRLWILHASIRGLGGLQLILGYVTLR
jgi:hypothetical protein